ncbi:MAG TPA: IPT/TIG domain-containing protein [Acidisarcina sp.]
MAILKVGAAGEQAPSRRGSVCGRGLLTFVACGMVMTGAADAGGPRWVAGSSYSDPAAEGKPIVWRGGVVSYYTDNGPLSATVDEWHADAMVRSAAAFWNNVPTAAVSIAAAGNLREDVNGSNIAASNGAATAPADIVPTATQVPVAVVYDADGAVTDALLGPDASDPISCLQGGVTSMVDGMATDGTINHALVVLNGRCATPDKMELMQYLITRAFGRVLGLDWSQANDGIFGGSAPLNPSAEAGWPLMHPVERLCTSSFGSCMPEALSLRPDDIASLSRLYPVTASNIGSFSGKTLTAGASVSIRGVIHFPSGQGMQGVNVVAQPLLAGTNQPDPRYTVSAVSGALFQGNAGNRVNGILDADGNPLSQFGSNDASLEGAFDLSGMVLPAGVTQADYQLSFEAINPLDTGTLSVGPYGLGQVTPSGSLAVVVIRGLSAGATDVEDITVGDADSTHGLGADGSEDRPAERSGNGEWLAKLDGYGHSSWFHWHIRGGRLFTVETEALDAHGQATADKARPVLGIWNGIDPVDARPTNPVLHTLQPFNGAQVGLTTMWVQTVADANVRLAVADQRGDGRPDYLYRGRVLYAESVTPQRIALAGAAVTIKGVGFRPQNQVTVNGVPAAVMSLTSTEISVFAPPAGPGVTGNVDVTVTDPATLGSATIIGGISYDAGDTDSISLVSAPSGTVPMDVPIGFQVKTVGPDGATPAGGLAVTYSVISGAAVLGCGQSSCTVMSTGDGLATLAVTASSPAAAVVSAALANGASVQTRFAGSLPPAIAALTSPLYLAQGATLSWNPVALVLSGGTPTGGRAVTWSSASGGVVVTAPSTTSDASGHATGQIAVGPLPVGVTAQVNACLPGGPANCTSFQVASANPAIAELVAVSGTAQIIEAIDTPMAVVLRVEDAAGHPIAGAKVYFYETLSAWQPDCPAQGRCPAAPVLSKQTVSAVSGVDGLVTLAPLKLAGTATLLNGTAVTGGDSTLSFQIEQHP